MKKIFLILIVVFYTQFGHTQVVKPTGPFPATVKTDYPLLEIPPDNDVKNLRRIHYAYSPADRNFSRDYLMHKYLVYFKLPVNSFVQICGTKDPVIRDNTENPYEQTIGNRKPMAFCQFFSPRIIVINNTTGKSKIYPAPVSGDYGKRISTAGYQLLLDEPGEYEIKFEQTFPEEVEFRRIVKIPVSFTYSNLQLEKDEYDRLVQEGVDTYTNQYRAYLGKRVRKTIYRYHANTDFLIASIGDSYMSGEGNPMTCGAKIPSGNGGFFDGVVDFYHDVKDRLKTALDLIGRGISVQSLSEFMLGSFTLNTAVLFPVVEQIIGPCTSSILNMAGATGPNFDVPPYWIENGDKTDTGFTSRSYINGAGITAFGLENKYPGLVTTYLTYATSGATTENLYQKRQHPYQRGSQIEELALNLAGTNRTIDVLTLAIGANDVAFSTDIGNLIKNDLRPLWNVSGAPLLAELGLIKSLENPAEVRRRMLREMDKLDAKFSLLNQKIKSLLKVNKVVLLEYPNAQFTKLVNGQAVISKGCGVLDQGSVGISQADAVLMTEMGDSLNVRLEKLAAKYHWEFAKGMTSDFNGHGYCSAEPYYNSETESCKCQGNYQGMLHPNRKGFQKVSDRVTQKLDQLFDFQSLSKPKPRLSDPHLGL